MNINPHYIDSYPSSIYAIAKYMKENNVAGIHPKAIITSSETLFDYQREIIEKVFAPAAAFYPWFDGIVEPEMSIREKPDPDLSFNRHGCRCP